MTILQVELAERSYPIYIEPGALSGSSILGPHIPGQKAVIISNETVAPLYLESLKAHLAGIDVEQILIPDGEAYKTLGQFEEIMGHLLALGADRQTTLIALGGGVVGDITGFAAACYQRGVPFVQVPTTLLAQVDSSVGGKTAVNHALGKNMIGAFYQPKAVLIDPSTLASLPKREFAAGMAEVIKYGIIKDPDFFSWLETHQAAILKQDSEFLSQMIARCCEIKAQIVAEDEQEAGIRAWLNLGHTFGHAIEAEQGYGKWLHGEAVAAGIVLACKASEALGWLSASESRRIADLLAAFECPVQAPKSMGFQDYMRHMTKDKKVSQGKIAFILPLAIGQVSITRDLPEDILKSLLSN